MTLLEDLLKAIREGGTLTTASLAQRLNTSPALIEAMLDDLARRGLLRDARPDSACASGACSGCDLAGACKPHSARVWSSGG